ncbi:MAG: hypothetical protein ACRDA4_10655 [Filifactoraceae bacterium]
MEQEFNVLVSKILDLKEEQRSIEANLELYKKTLLMKMRENDISRINTLDGKAQIIAFSRDNLKKYETIGFIKEVNEGNLNEIPLEDLLNVSNVCFVLVKPS